MNRLAAALLLLSASAAARGAVISERPDHVAVTIYHEGLVRTQDLTGGDASRYSGLAMISESRSVDLPEGASEIQLRGVAATMVPETADLDGLGNATLERNFDYDLLSPASLLDKSIGQTVHVVRTDLRTGAQTEQDAIVVSGSKGPILKVGDRYQALKCDWLPEKLVFDHVPDGLIDRPTLTVKVRTQHAGRYALTLRYIATGLNWSADYVARVRPDGASLDLSGWLTLANSSETGFPAASVDVIAGHVATTGEDLPPEIEAANLDAGCWNRNPLLARIMTIGLPVPAFRISSPSPVVASTAVASSRVIAARNLGDYKQYPLPEPTDVAAQQTKQVQFLDQPSVPFDRVFVGRAAGYQWAARQILPALTVLRLRNTEQRGLGKPLPAGGVMTTVRTGGEEMLAAQGLVEDTPVGLPLEIPAGETIDVTAQAREVENRTIGPKNNQRHLHAVEVTLANRKGTAIRFEWRQAAYQETKVTEETEKHEIRNGDLSWGLTLAPGERRLLRYTLDAAY